MTATRGQRMLRTAGALGCLFLLSLVPGCAHPAERALQGRWYGESVENFESEAVASATGWARGTSFEFRGKNLQVTVPAEKSRNGVYELSAIEERNVTLSVLDSRGEQSEIELIVDDADSIRWVLGEGRTLVLKKQD